jgi:vacuolar-type H+-ATPase subunit E/Vma4
MTDQVQHLIDRIRREAVDTASRERQALLARAEDEARAIVAAAEARAAATVAAAGQQAEALVERGSQSLAQAARDLLLTFGARLDALLAEVATAAAAETLRPEVVQEVLLLLADGMARNGLTEGLLRVDIPVAQREELSQFLLGRLRDRFEKGVELRLDPELQAGFRLRYADGRVRHDFTPEAVAKALLPNVRGQLAAIVQRAAVPEEGGRR